MVRHHWWVLGVWIVPLIAAGLAYPHLMSKLSAPDYSVTGADSAVVTDLIGADFTAAGAEQDVIVFALPMFGMQMGIDLVPRAWASSRPTCR